nr:hypothetical protein [Fodinicola feengrottensis]
MLVRQTVQHGAVDHGTESTGESGQRRGVGDDEGDGNSLGRRLGAVLLNGGGGRVERGDLMSPAGQIKRVLPQTATTFQDRIGDLTGLFHLDDEWLWPIELPGNHIDPRTTVPVRQAASLIEVIEDGP